MITTNKMDWVTCTAWIKLEEFGPRALYDDGVAICLMSYHAFLGKTFPILKAILWL
jgi:hypothetical protein